VLDLCTGTGALAVVAARAGAASITVVDVNHRALAAALLERFETLVLNTVVTHGGRAIKNLGDEVLFVTDDPVSAADTALALMDLISAEELMPPMHAGLAYGPVLYRGGDVFGPVVNIAARIAGLARQDSIRVDDAMATALGDTEQFALSPCRGHRVRGYLQLRSHRLRWATSG